METLPPLYTALVQALSCHRGWLDARHLQTLAWMVSGLIQAKTVSLGAWALHVHSRATFVASTIRRFRRFLDNWRIEVDGLYAPLLAQVLLEGNPQRSFCQMLWMGRERILHGQAAFFSSPSTNTAPAMSWSRSR